MLFPKSGKDASQPGRQVTDDRTVSYVWLPIIANPRHRVTPILVSLEVPSEVIDLVMILAAAIWNCQFPPTRMANFECSCWETETANSRTHWYDRFLCIKQRGMVVVIPKSRNPPMANSIPLILDQSRRRHLNELPTCFEVLFRFLRFHAMTCFIQGQDSRWKPSFQLVTLRVFFGF